MITYGWLRIYIYIYIYIYIKCIYYRKYIFIYEVGFPRFLALQRRRGVLVSGSCDSETVGFFHFTTVFSGASQHVFRLSGPFLSLNLFCVIIK
jgi:hypothetical protein